MLRVFPPEATGVFCWGSPAWWEGEDCSPIIKKGTGQRGSFFERNWLSHVVKKNQCLIYLCSPPFFVYVGAAKLDFIFLFEMICGFAACPVTQQALQTAFPNNELSKEFIWYVRRGRRSCGQSVLVKLIAALRKQIRASPHFKVISKH